MKFLIVLISFYAIIDISFCPKSPRMVLHFSYDGNKSESLKKIKDLLLSQKYKIKQYDSNEGFLITEYKYFEWGTGERMLAMIVDIDDKITILGKGKMAIPVASLGEDKDLLKIKKLDRLPYKVQKKIFLTIISSMDSLGYKRINRWP